MTPSPPLPVHVQRMESAFDLVISHEDAWYQGDWRLHNDESSCGSSYCYAGWVAHDAGFQPLTNFDFPHTAQLSGTTDTLDYVVLVPPGDRVAPLLARDAMTITGFSPMDQRAVDELLAPVPDGTLFVHILTAANALLRVGEEDGIDYHVFGGSNTLRNIRAYIDRARQANGFPPRDFSAEPAQYRWDEVTSEEAKKLIRERVDWFNENWAKTGQVVTLR